MIFVMSLLPKCFTAKSANEGFELVMDHYMVSRIRPLGESLEAVETAVLVLQTLLHLNFITHLRCILNI